MKRWTFFFGMVAFVFLGTPSAFATTYYIDFLSGADTNAGTTKTTALKHIPGMVGCSNTCSSVNPVAGDRFILKGGVTWAGVFPINFTWSGSSVSPIYIGVDQTWYSGASWSRPVWDLRSADISAPFISLSGSYVTLDNIEMEDFYWSGPHGYGSYSQIVLGTGSDFILENLYVHSWSHGSTSVGTPGQGAIVVQGDTSGGNPGSILKNCIFDGSPNGTDSMIAVYGGPQTIEGNVFENMSNGIDVQSGAVTIFDNNIGPINSDFAGTHEDGIHMNGSDNHYVYDNVLHDVAAEPMKMPSNSAGGSFYIWNNVIYNSNPGISYFLVTLDTCDATDSGCYGSALNTHVYLYNNSMYNPTNDPCVYVNRRTSGTELGYLDMRNNFCATPSSTGIIGYGVGVANSTVSNNVTMSTANSLNAGLGPSQTPYALQPTSSTCTDSSPCPVGYGTNLTSLAIGSLASLASGTGYACTVTAGNAVSCPMRNGNARPASGAWDAGAYYYYSTASSAPAPPLGVNAVVN